MKKILLVDEEILLLEPIIDIIESTSDREVFVATSCSEAIKYFHEISPDYIVLDSLMPVGDLDITKDIITEDEDAIYGLQLLKYFSSKNREIKIIGYTVLHEERIIKEYHAANATYICKLGSDSFEHLINILTKEE